jgi:hypothetical protein
MTVSNSSLAGVSASAPDEAWAVGDFAGEDAFNHPLVEHWNGTGFTNVEVPQPLGMQAKLEAVDDLGPANAWAVGTSFPASIDSITAGRTLIEHWNGSEWTIVASPNPASGGPSDLDVLDAVGGSGPQDLWAAGWDDNEATGTIEMLFEHWNGISWKAATSPTPLGGAQFASAITAISSDDVWAVGVDRGDGSTLAGNWNGHAWSIVATPNIAKEANPENELTGVTEDGGGDVWASGFAQNVRDKNLAVPFVLHWKGKRWTITRVPRKGGEGSRLTDVQVLSPTDVWAVGQSQDENGSILSLTEQYNGSAWKIAASPDPGRNGSLIDNSLDSLSSAGGTSLLAVGAQETTGQCCLRTLAIGTAAG